MISEAKGPSGPTGPGSDDKSKTRPNEARFNKEYERIQKIDPDATRSRPKKREEDEEEEVEEAKTSSPYEPTSTPAKSAEDIFPETPIPSTSSTATPPEDFTTPPGELPPPPQYKPDDVKHYKPTEDEKNKLEEIKKGKSKAYLSSHLKETEKKKHKKLGEEKKEIQAAIEKQKKEVKPPPITPEKKEKEDKLSIKAKHKQTLPQEREESLPVEKEKTPQYAGGKEHINPFTQKKEKTFEPSQLPPSTHHVTIDTQTLTQASAVTAEVSPFISKDVLPLFESMVRTIIQISKQGITETQVTIDTKRFVGCKLFFERYSTSPDSFNIRLTGPQESVKLFNDNISSLIDAFQAAYNNKSIKFQIGRLTAEYEPLFRRKKSIGEESKDMGNM